MIIKIKARLNAGKSEIIKKEDKYFAYLKSPPENNKANIELINLLNKYFKRRAKIKSGFTSRIKIIEIENEI